MALTIETTTSGNFTYKPTGWTAPATTIALTNPIEKNFTITIAASGNTHASDCSAGLTTLLAAIEAYISATYLPTTLKVCTDTQTVNAIVQVNSIAKANSEACPYLTGSEVFTVTGLLRYE